MSETPTLLDLVSVGDTDFLFVHYRRFIPF